ncbi:MAG: metal ABC transporter permease [Alphaproteobacteria bacterium]|nr:metal ABC transporter permease [Alphaproteobacteria bacterium]MBF0251024.1 metal ABC transporter permease [Alphaproteobacteria bacterium]
MDEFLMRAALAGAAVAVAAGPLGAFVVWRRMAYFGGALSHTALLGVSLGFLLGVSPELGVALTVVAAALVMGGARGVRGLSLDTLLGIVAHAALALGLIVAAWLDDVRLDLMGYLFGDILAVGWADVGWMWGGALAVLAALARLWRPLLSATVHADLAQVEGVDVRRVELAFMLLLALVVALAMKMVGILLVTSMLVIPAAAARAFARTPEGMGVLAAVAGLASVALGLGASYQFDAPAGPAIVVAVSLVFVVGVFRPKDA